MLRHLGLEFKCIFNASLLVLFVNFHSKHHAREYTGEDKDEKVMIFYEGCIIYFIVSISELICLIIMIFREWEAKNGLQCINCLVVKSILENT